MIYGRDCVVCFCFISFFEKVCGICGEGIIFFLLLRSRYGFVIGGLLGGI